MNFQDELEKLIMDNAILGVDSGQAYFVDLDQAVTSIINLVEKEVIQPDQESDHQMSHRQGKGLQRAIIRGNDD